MDQLTPALAQEWSLHRAVVVGSTPVAWGRQVLFVDGGVGRVAVKVFDEEVALGLVRPSDEAITRRLSVLDYLADRNFQHSPRLLRTRTGDAHVRHNGQVAYALEWIAGVAPPPTPVAYAELGRVSALLNAEVDFPHPYPIPINATIDELLKSGHADAFGPLYRRLVTRLDILNEPPLALVHGEINRSNALLAGGRLYLLDWDAAGMVRPASTPATH